MAPWFRFPSAPSRSLIGAIALLLSSASWAEAASIRLGRLTFSEVSGNFQITGGRLDDDFYTIAQDVTGPDVNLLMAINGLPRLNALGFRVQSIVTNRTGTPWIFFDHELRERPTVPSPEEDGLSFAQQFRDLRPTSDRLPGVDEVTDVRDFINYGGGVVGPGESVIFRYAITDPTPRDTFYVLQRPNFRPIVGFVPPPVIQPPPPVPPSPPIIQPPPPAPSPSPSPIASPAPSPIASPPSSPPAEAVPEPSTILGLGVASLAGAWLKRRQNKG